MERFGIKNLHLLRTLIRSILSSYSKEFSIYRIFKIIKSQGISVSKKTLYNYFEYLQDAMFCFPLSKFSYSIRTSDLSIPKVYLADIGLAAYSRRFEIGRAMENTVYLELRRQKDKKPNLNLYYWREFNKEIDFLIQDGAKVESVMQVTYELLPENHNREVGPLLKSSSELDCSNMQIITWDDDRELIVEGKKIKMIPLWRWLLFDQS